LVQQLCDRVVIFLPRVRGVRSRVIEYLVALVFFAAGVGSRRLVPSGLLSSTFCRGGA